MTRKDERRDRQCEEVRVGERQKRNIKKEIRQEKSVGVRKRGRDRGSKSGEEKRREVGRGGCSSELMM